MSTYVMSDLHGHYDKYLRMLKRIRFTDTDTLYILGDVIDRGPEPIKLLLDIASRENVELLLGNHELMMLNAATDGNTNLWFYNGGAITAEQFLKLPNKEQQLIIDFISELQLTKTIDCNSKKFYLAHSTYSKKLDLNRSEEKDIFNVVWDREYPFNKLRQYPRTKSKYKDYILVSGHTSTLSLFKKERNNDYYLEHPYKTHIFKGNKGHYINIDCGLAGESTNECIRRLGCLRLEDMEEFYVS